MTDSAGHAPVLCGCLRCGQVSGIRGGPQPNVVHRCPACHARLKVADHDGNELVRQRTAALALAALVLYPAAVTLPVLSIRQLGHAHETGVLGGIADLLSDGSLLLGLLVLLCSVLVPLVKLLGLLLLCTRRIEVSARHRGRLWSVIEWTGRWGMLDVLLVAAVVAMVKVGEVVDIQPGPGVALFTAVVMLSLASAMAFDPRAMWVRQRGVAG